MENRIPIFIGNDATSRLVEYCRSHAAVVPYRRKGAIAVAMTLVADQNTYRALGQAVDQALRAQGFDVNTVVLIGDDIIADERTIVQVLVRGDASERVYLAVGSGTITDIVRFVSHRTRLPFIAIPTAPSVDGFTSIGAPLVINRIKQTLITQAPMAVFADLPTLRAAPHRLIASGFGDIVGKFTSLADWKLGHLIMDEEYSETIAQRAQRAAESCAESCEGIGHATEDGIRRLMDGLIESGLCMLDFGKTTLASGTEHHLSHYWEMRLLWEDRPSLLHGAKVGVACVMAAGLYDRIKDISAQQAERLMDLVTLPDREVEVRHIQDAYGPIADMLLEEQSSFLNLDDRAYDRLKQRIVDHWPDIQQLAGRVPSAEQIREMLRAAGAPTEPAVLGLSDQEVARGLRCCHYFRNRFTVLKLSRMLGIAA